VSPARALLAACLLSAPALAAPARVVLIRHGEKPPEGSELDERGRQRAQALVGYIERDPVVAAFGPPAAIYAMAPKGEGGSVRAIQTVEPLAADLGQAVRADFKKDQIEELAAAVLQEPPGKTVLVCWEHTVIPAIVKALGLAGGPSKWKGSVYDRAWIVGFADGKPASFKDVPQRLLPGDSSD